MEPTLEQIRKLEAAMTEQFALLASAAALRIGLARQFGLQDPKFLKFNAKFAELVDKWILREVKYERELIKKHVYGIIASGDLKRSDFFYSAALPKLDTLVRKWNVEKTVNGIGFLPLLIWPVVWVVGLITAAIVADDLTTTTQEKAELLKSTQETALALGLTPEQATGLISQTQKEASQGSGLGDTVKWGVGLLAAVLIVPQILKSTNK